MAVVVGTALPLCECEEAPCPAESSGSKAIDHEEACFSRGAYLPEISGSKAIVIKKKLAFREGLIGRNFRI